MVNTSTQKIDIPPCELQAALDDRRFWLEVRRGLITIARAYATYHHNRGLLVLLGVEHE
jgi:hypothetical protein